MFDSLVFNQEATIDPYPPCSCYCRLLCCTAVGYTTSDLVFMWQSDPVQMDEIALPQFDIKQEDIKYGNCTKYYQGTGCKLCMIDIVTTSQTLLHAESLLSSL